MGPGIPLAPSLPEGPTGPGGPCRKEAGGVERLPQSHSTDLPRMPGWQLTGEFQVALPDLLRSTGLGSPLPVPGVSLPCAWEHLGPPRRGSLTLGPEGPAGPEAPWSPEGPYTGGHGRAQVSREEGVGPCPPPQPLQVLETSG